MKKVNRLLALTALLAVCALTAVAQDAQPAAAAATAAPADKQCNDLYARFVDNRKKDQKVAYEAGREYVEKCPNAEAQYVTYVKKFVNEYGKASRKFDLGIAIDEKKYADAFALAKQIVAEEPEDVRTHVSISYAGLMNATAGATSNPALNPEAINYTRQAIQLIESGKTAEEWRPFASKDDALGWLHYTLGVLTLKEAPAEATTHFIKSAQAQSATKTDPSTYYYIATGYQLGDYKRMSDEYKVKYADKEETPESKAAFETVNQVMDRIVDAYARAIASARASNKPEAQAKVTEWMKELAEFYKFRNNNADAGLEPFITGIMAKPLPSGPITPVVPTPAATTETTTTGGTTSTTTPTTGGATATPTTGATTATPTTTPTTGGTTATPATQQPAATRPSTAQPSTARPSTTRPSTAQPTTSPAPTTASPKPAPTTASPKPAPTTASPSSGTGQGAKPKP